MRSNIIDLSHTQATAKRESRLGGFVAQGMQGTKAVVFSPLTRSVFRLSPLDMKEINLKMICGADWCEDVYTVLHPKKDEMVFEYRRLATDILSACRAKGAYVESYERRAGVCARPDGGLVVNGRELWTPEGETLEHGTHHGRVYTACGEVGFERGTTAAMPDEVARVRAAFGALEWRSPVGAELLLGFFGVSIVSSALRRRPHILLTGGAGIGKSTALEMMAWLLGPVAYRATGPQTMAAYYQALNGTTRAVVLDEFEADAGKRTCKDMFEMARMSYSLQEGDEGIVRGTANGSTRSYRTCAPFLAAGITPGRMDPTDVTRWVILEAVARKSDAARLTEAQAREIGAAPGAPVR